MDWDSAYVGFVVGAFTFMAAHGTGEWFRSRYRIVRRTDEKEAQR